MLSRISSAKKVPRLLVNFSKPGYNLHPLTISGGLGIDYFRAAQISFKYFCGLSYSYLSAKLGGRFAMKELVDQNLLVSGIRRLRSLMKRSRLA